jgi:hypothetical protein
MHRPRRMKAILTLRERTREIIKRQLKQSPTGDFWRVTSLFSGPLARAQCSLYVLEVL